MSSLTAYDFACAMQAHWTAPKPHGLENVSSPKLMSLWSAMGQAFLGAIQASQDHKSPDRHLWRICRPETGTGKTQGIRVFSAMVARENLKLPPQSRIGVLIVTRQTDEADRLAAEINETFARMVGEDKERYVEHLEIIGPQRTINSTSAPLVAVAKHSKPTGRASREQVRAASVLILTHASYVSALDRLEQADEDRWSSMIEWDGGVRRLTVIDETITSLLEEYSINIDSLRKVLAYIPEHLRSHYCPQIATLETLLQSLRTMRDRREELAKAKVITGDKSPAAPDAVVWDRSSRWRADDEGERQLHLYGDMGGLRAEMLKLTDVVGVRKFNGVVTTTTMAKLADETLQAVEMFANRWMSYHHHYIKGDTLNQTRLIFPADIPAPVVLDATASESVLWHLLGKDKVRFVDIPTGSRSYANMTLHIAVADGLGLTTMKRAEVAQDRIVRLVAYLKGRTNGKTLLVLHQAAEYLAAACREDGWLSTAHYGRIDGLNAWHDHSTVCILGLDYRDRTWVNGLFAAMEDHKGNYPQIGATIQQTDDTYREMDRRQLTVSIIQALNRVRCRHVVDVEGNCEPCEGFLFLPDNDTGRAIRQSIKREMPGIVIKEWDYQLDPPSRSIRKGSGHARLLEFMRASPAGEVSLKEWAESVGLGSRARKEIAMNLRNSEHDLAKSLAEIGCTYSVIGQGRGAKSMLIKRPLAIAA